MKIVIVVTMSEEEIIIYTLDFTTKFYLYGSNASSKVIKTVQVEQYTDILSVNILRENKDIQLQPNPTTIDVDDDFGFNETTSFFQDVKNFDDKSGEDK